MKTIEPILGGQYFASLLVVGLFDGGQWSSATKEALCSEGRRGGSRVAVETETEKQFG